ncbi:hypothetical protein MXAZACID_16874 [Acidocella sp. MX-AZ02]|nr:hypothetical protein MXAZACID_16874 [Acidocella sp. MX-AZ02]
MPVAELAQMLARQAEAVCRYYICQPGGARGVIGWWGMFITRRGGPCLCVLRAASRARGLPGVGKTQLRARMAIYWI